MDWTSPKSKLPRIHSIHIPSCSHCLVGMQRTNHFRCVLHARSLLSCSQNCLLDCWIVGDLALSRNGDNSVIFILFRSRKLWGNYGKDSVWKGGADLNQGPEPYITSINPKPKTLRAPLLFLQYHAGFGTPPTFWKQILVLYIVTILQIENAKMLTSGKNHS